MHFSKIASKGIFWEYCSTELPQREYFENTVPQNCLKWNILIIQFRIIASKEMLWKYNSVELPKKRVWEYNSGELPQMKCFENTILQNCLKGKCGNTTPQSCPKENIFWIQFCRIASKEIFWEYNSIELLQRSIVEIHLRRVALKQNVGIQL